MPPLACRCSSICRHASLAPPWAGPHKHPNPAAMAANGLVPDEPHQRTVDGDALRSEEHTSEPPVTNATLVCRLLLEKKNQQKNLFVYNSTINYIALIF